MRVVRPQSAPGDRVGSDPRVPASVVLATLVINLLALALPLTTLQVYDRIIPNHARETFAVLLGFLFVAVVFDFILKSARSALLAWQSAQFVRQTSDAAVTRLLAAPPDTVEREPLSVHINRYNAIGALGDHFAGQSRIVAIDLPFVGIGLAVMALVGGGMALVPLLLFFVFAALSIRRSRIFRRMIEQRAIQDNKKYDFVAEVLEGILSVKAMAMEPQMQRRFERLQQGVAEITASSILAGQAAQSTAMLYGSVSQVVVVMIGASRVIDDQLSLGALACCTMLSGQILQPLLRTIAIWTERASIAHRRNEADALLRLPIQTAGGSAIEPTGGSIIFDNVSFSFSAESAPLFTNVNFEIPEGSVVGVQGEDGSGRSTLLKLLRAELIPMNGKVTIGGVQTTDLGFANIRLKVAYVGSSPAIFRGTILENLTLFRASKSTIARRMSHFVGLDRIVRALPDGFETQVGESIAEELPVSAQQQISLARALTCEPSVLILDEVNTVLDRVAEAALIRAIHALRGRTTVIIATHRPSILALSDQLISLSGTTVVCKRAVVPVAARGAA
jgi:ATP-binding cassette, subfamily C, bacterial LapB